MVIGLDIEDEMEPVQDIELSGSRLLISNWKAYREEDSILEFIKKITAAHEETADTNLVALPFPYLISLKEKIEDSNIRLGCNAMNSVEEGSFTEHNAGQMIKEA